MKDPKTAIQTAYYALLDGQVSYGGSVVPVGDKANVPDTYPQIVLSDWTEVDDSDKSSFGSELTFTIHIYDRTQSESYSRAGLYDIVGQIKGLLRTRPQSVDLSPDFNLVRLIIDNETSLPKTKTDTHITYRRQVRFRMNVEEL